MKPILPDVPYPLLVILYEDEVFDLRAIDRADDKDWLVSLGAMATEMARDMNLAGHALDANLLDIVITYRDVDIHDPLVLAHHEDTVVRQSDEVHEHFLDLLTARGAHIIR